MLFYLKRLTMVKKKVNHSFLFLCAFSIVLVSIGFSALNQNLMISGDANYYLKGNFVTDCNGNRFQTTVPENLSGLAKIMADQAYLDNGRSQYVTNCSGVQFDAISSNTNGRGVYEIASTKNDTYPIYYYRGQVSNNNVIFANHCWKAVRTTDTGGVKLIYNGEVDGNQCLSSRETHVGYGGKTSVQTLNSNYYYGTDYTYANGVFSLTGNIEQTTWSATTAPGLIGKYTCKSTSSTGTCSTLYLIESVYSNTQGYLIPLNGNSNYQRFGSINYNNKADSLADFGYMYNTRYTGGTQSHMMTTLTGGASLSTNYWYGTDITWDSSTNKYVLVNPYKITSTSEYSSLIGKFTMSSSDSTSSNHAKYISRINGSIFWYVYLIDAGNHTLSYFNNAFTYGDSYTNNGNGTYTINNATTIHNSDWANIYTEIRNKFICINASNNTCNDLYYSTSSVQFNYMYYLKPIAELYKYGNSFTYNSSTGTYTLTNTVNIWNYTDSTDKETIATHHYTCRNSTGTCTTLYYVYYTNSYTLYYMNLTGGKNIETAINEMMNNSSVNTNNSVIKTGIEAWYKKYLLDYSSYIEDIVYCNERALSTTAFNPNGGSISEQPYSTAERREHDIVTPTFECSKNVDRFSVSNTIGNGKLAYPVGLLTIDESRYAGTYINRTQQTYYLYDGSYFWTITPYHFFENSSVYKTGSVNTGSDPSKETYLRPVISLSPEVDIIEGGDGTETNPYKVDARPTIHTSTFANDSWDTIVAAIRNGQYDSYNVGDTKQVDLGTLGTHTLRISNTSNPASCSESNYSQTACGFVLEFADIINTHNMNSTLTNVGGWPASELRTYLNSTVYNALPQVLRDAIIDTIVKSGHGTTSGETNFITTDKLYPLSSVEVMGVRCTVDTVTTSETRQLDYYKDVANVTSSSFDGAIKKLNGTAKSWWMRSASSSTSESYGTTRFGNVYTTGNATYHADATNTFGVSPAFRLGSAFESDSWDVIINNINNGNTNNYNVGDTKAVDLGTLGTHTLRVANKSTPFECSGENYSQTACGFVVEFANEVSTHNFNSTLTNVGGWPASELRTYVNSTIFNAFPQTIRDGIIDTKVISGHGTTSGETNFVSTDKLYPLSTVEVMGVRSASDSLTVNETRQLDYYKDVANVTSSSFDGAIKKLNGTATAWWLRSSSSSTSENYGTTRFMNVYTTGSPAYHSNATNVYGVSPAFRLGSKFTMDSWDTIAYNIQNGNTSAYHLGDQKRVDLGTLGTHTIRLANNTAPSSCNNSGFSQTACGYVFEFADVISNHNFNSTSTNVGGWPASEMRTYLNTDIYNALPSSLRNVISNTTVVSGHGTTSGETNFTSTDKLYLLTSVEIRGTPGSADTLTTSGTRQLDYYKDVANVTASSYSGAIKYNGGTAKSWWLRSASSSTTDNYGVTRFTNVYTSGTPTYHADATTSMGVSPAFRIT